MFCFVVVVVFVFKFAISSVLVQSKEKLDKNWRGERRLSCACVGGRKLN